MTTLLLVVGISLVVSFLCSILEAVLLSISHSYVLLLEEQGGRTGKILKRLRKNLDEPIAAILTLNTMAHTVGASMGGALALQIFGDKWIALFSAFLTFVILVFSEILPKTIGARYWQVLAPLATIVLHYMVLGMKPLLIPLGWINRLMTPKKSEQATVSRAELAILAEIGRREGSIDDEEWQVVKNVFRFDTILVREVMTPRLDMRAISIDSTVAEAKDVMISSGHFRLPVYRDSIDDIEGVVVARDILAAEKRSETKLLSIMRDVLVVPGTKRAEELLSEMRTLQEKIAIVLDEFGGTAGLVTLEDLLEEIVGEIRDEHEVEAPDFFKHKDGTVRVLATASIDNVNERLHLELATDQYDTIGGYILGELGKVPEIGDEVVLEDGSIFKVISVNGLRAEWLLYVKSLEAVEMR